MKKFALALSVMAMSVSSAMAATMPSDADLSAGEASTPITLSGSFIGTAIPCIILSVPSDLTEVIEFEGSNATTSSNAGEFSVNSLANYIPQISVGTISGSSPVNSQLITDLFTAKIGVMGANANTFTEPTGNVNMVTGGGTNSDGYQTYKKSVLFEEKVADAFDKFEEGQHSISAEVTITCTASP